VPLVVAVVAFPRTVFASEDDLRNRLAKNFAEARADELVTAARAARSPQIMLGGASLLTTPEALAYVFEDSSVS
jgi:hypothetical protein